MGLMSPAAVAHSELTQLWLRDRWPALAQISEWAVDGFTPTKEDYCLSNSALVDKSKVTLCVEVFLKNYLNSH